MVDTQYQLPASCGMDCSSILSFADRVNDILQFQPSDDIEKIVSHLRGTISYLPLGACDTRNASIIVESGGSFIIQLSSFLFPLQKRFSIAHELGHLFLHSNYGEVPIKAFYSDSPEYSKVETEADYFAYGFLMPLRSFNKIERMFGADTVQIAAYFMVPEPIVRQYLPIWSAL